MRLLISARNRAVGIEDGIVVPPEGAFDRVLEVPDAEIRPGLINAHDHLHRNHYGRLGNPPYANAYDWARDIQARHAAHIAEGRAVRRREALLIGAWKNLFCGVTRVVHHDAWEADFEDFPLAVVRIETADSLGMAPPLVRRHPSGAFCLHLAEGTDGIARDEVGQLADAGLLGPDLIAVHGVGMDAAAIAAFRASGAALCWCPSSNHFLLGRTASPELLREGVDVLLGSDSLLTGAGDLLDELRFARSLNCLDDARLIDAVGATAARRLGIAAPAIEPGTPADLSLLSRPLLEASAENVMLVIANGAPRVVRPDLVAALGDFLPQGSKRQCGAVTRWTSEGRFGPGMAQAA